jgi:hypothetical protein
LTDYASIHNIKPQSGISDEASAEAWYAFSDVLSWSRTVVERLKRKPANRMKFREQGLIPALRPKRLRKRCDSLLNQLQTGPVGQTRLLANFLLHCSMVQHPFSGVQINNAGEIVLPIPDAPSGPVSHWYLLAWNQNRDGFTLAEELWQAIQTFIDDLLDAFEKAVPKRLRKNP